MFRVFKVLYSFALIQPQIQQNSLNSLVFFLESFCGFPVFEVRNDFDESLAEVHDIVRFIIFLTVVFVFLKRFFMILISTLVRKEESFRPVFIPTQAEIPILSPSQDECPGLDRSIAGTLRTTSPGWISRSSQVPIKDTIE